MLQWLYTKLQFFTNNQVLLLLQYLTAERFAKLSQSQQADLRYLFSVIDENTSKVVLASIVNDIVEQELYDKPITVFRVNKGENFSITIQQKDTSDDYSGYKLTAREDFDNILLSDNIDGTDEEYQDISFTNLNLPAGAVYNIRLQLEQNINGQPNGNALSLLATLYFIVQKSIDSNV